jgi:hypothetical protein
MIASFPQGRMSGDFYRAINGGRSVGTSQSEICTLLGTKAYSCEFSRPYIRLTGPIVVLDKVRPDPA